MRSHAATTLTLTGSVRTTAGLKVRSKFALRTYPTGVKVTDAEMRELSITRNAFHGDWNYTIYPRR